MRGKVLVLVLVVVGVVAGVLFWHRPPPRVSVPTTAPASQPVATARPATSPAPPAPPAVHTFLDLVRLSNPTYAATQPLERTLPMSEALRLIVKEPVYLDRGHGDLWVQRADAEPTASVLNEAADFVQPRHRGLRARAATTQPADKPHIHCTREAILFVHWIEDQNGERPVLIAKEDKVLLLDGSRRFEVPGSDFDWERAASWDEKIVVPTSRGVSILSFDGVGVKELASPALATGTHGAAQYTFDIRGVLAWVEGGKGAARFVDGAWKLLDWPQSFLHLIPLGDGSVLQIIPAGGKAVTLGRVNLDGSGADTTQPATLDQMTLLDGTLELVTRFWDTGAMFYTRGGVSMPQATGETTTVIPAWLSVRPGQSVQVLPANLVNDLDPAQCEVRAFDAEIIVSDEVHGPRRFTGQDLVPLLPKGLRGFREFLGCDCEGRWLYVRPGSGVGRETLIVDPQLPDETPRLPVWAMTVTGGVVGWDAADEPVIKNVSSYALGADGWRGLDDAKEKIITQVGGPTTATSGPAGVLLVDAQGTRYEDGQNTLTLTAKDGRKTVWELPPQALGVAPVRLVQTPDGRLFLFNAAGRVLRIRATPGGKQPFVLEGTFTHKIPNIDAPTRIWVDPAGRIDIAYGGNKLAILFAGGRVPASIQQLMPVSEEDSLQD